MGSTAALLRLLRESEIDPESECGRRLSDYLALLEKWNARVNLTSSTEWSVLGPLFREGIWASGLYPSESSAHLDIGSGAGFPALILKIVHPRLQLELVESREKKGQFLETVAYSLGLGDVKVRGERLVDYLRRCPDDRHWDCVSWKALKLNAGDLVRLHGHAKTHTQFWMFHGRKPAWEETEEVRLRFALERKERIPGRRESNLSIYAAR